MMDLEGSEEPSGGSPLWAKVTGIQFGLMSTSNILRLSVTHKSEVAVNPKDPKNAHLGLPVSRGSCRTCNGITVDQCQGHFDHVQLSLPIYHPNHVVTLVQLLRKICLNCGQLRKKNISPAEEALPALSVPHREVTDLKTDTSDGSKKRKRTSTLDPHRAHEGISSTADVKRKQKSENVMDEDVDDWPEEPKKGDWHENLIVLSSDDSDEELICKAKRVQVVEVLRVVGPSTSQTPAEIPGSSKKPPRKRKFASDLNGFTSKSASKFVDDAALESCKKPEKFKEKEGQTAKNTKKFGDKFRTPSKIESHSSLVVCKYCSASSRKLGYPEPEIRVHATSKGKSTEDPLSVVKVIKMRVNPKDQENLATDFWNFVEGSSTRSQNKKFSRYLLPSEALKILKRIPQENIARVGMKANVARPEALILECIPIPPNCTRLQEDAATNIGFKMGVDRATQAFERLLRKINSLKTSRFGKPTFQAAFMECSILQSLFQQYLREKGAPKSAPGKEKKKVDQSGRLQKCASRWSLDWFKRNFIGKRSAFSARNVVTGDPFLSVEEVGIPLDIAKHVTYAERVTALNAIILQKYIESGETLAGFVDSRACSAVRIVRDGERREVTRKTGITLEIGDIVHRNLKDGDLVFINRPPSLHKHSLLALKARIHTEATWTINPAICAPLHADFDGDCLHVFVPQAEESKAELQQLMTLPSQILPSPNEGTILGLSQDYILAAYLVTSSPVFVSKDEMQQLGLWSTKQIPVPTILKSPKGGPFWTGKQVIDLTIPENLSFVSSNKATVIQDGEIITCGEKPNWLASTKGLVRIVALDNAEAAAKHLDGLQSVLREWLLTHGFSLSLEDFYAAPDQHQRRKLKQEIEDSVEYAKCMAVGKQFLFDQKIQKENFRHTSSLHPKSALRYTRTKHDLEDVAISCFRQSQTQIGESLVESISDWNCNRLIAMVRSGSKGSSSKVMQQIGSLGLQVVHGDKLLSAHKNPKLVALAAAMGYSFDNELQDIWEMRGLVKSSLLDGLEPHEFFTHAISMRDGMFRQSQEIAGPGELFKKLMLFLRDIHIAYDGTVRNSCGLEIIQFQYQGAKSLTGEDTTVYGKETVMPGEAVGILAATAISQPAYQVMLEANANIGSRKLRPLELLQESMFPRSDAKLKASDRRSILRLSGCACDEKYCCERRILSLQAELQPVTVEMLATEIAIEYACESSERWEAFDFAAKGIKQAQLLPWIGHIQLDKNLLMEKRITTAMILERLEANVKMIKSVTRRCRLRGVMFCFREVGDCSCDLRLVTKGDFEKPPEKRANAPCLHFSFLRNASRKERNIKTIKQMDDETAQVLDTVEGAIIPVILNTVVKGFERIESASILWEDKKWSSPQIHENDGFFDTSDGEVVLEITVKELYCTCRGMPWQIIQESCLRVMDYVDWRRSSPYSIQEIKSIFGVDAAQDVLLQRFGLAAGDHVGKKHLELVADLMAHSGEIHGLTSYGYRDWMRSLQIPAPFTEGVFRAPMKHFMEAGRKGRTESFKGVLASSVFGKKVPVGTGADFMVKLNVEPQFSGLLSKMDSSSSGTAERDSGQSIDVLERLIGLKSVIPAENPPLVSSNCTHEGSDVIDSTKVECEWGSREKSSESGGEWGPSADGSKSVPIVTVASDSWGFDGKDANPTDAWGTNDNDNSQHGSQNCVTFGGGWE